MCTRRVYPVRDATLFRPPLQGHASKPDSVPGELEPFATSCSRNSTSRCRLTTQSAVSSTGPPEDLARIPANCLFSEAVNVFRQRVSHPALAPRCARNPLTEKSSLSFRGTCRSHLRADQTARCQAQGKHPSHSRPSPLSRTVHRWTPQTYPILCQFSSIAPKPDTTAPCHQVPIPRHAPRIASEGGPGTGYMARPRCRRLRGQTSRAPSRLDTRNR